MPTDCTMLLGRMLSDLVFTLPSIFTLTQYYYGITKVLDPRSVKEIEWTFLISKSFASCFQ